MLLPRRDTEYLSNTVLSIRSIIVRSKYDVITGLEFWNREKTVNVKWGKKKKLFG